MTLILDRTVIQLAQAELERRKRYRDMQEDAEEDLAAYVKMMWHVIEPQTQLVWGWVPDAMCDHLMAVTDGQIKRFSANVCPGSLKSLLLNVFWPSWEWGAQRMPHLRYLSFSYAAHLTERDNLRLRTLIDSPLYQECWGKVFGRGDRWGATKVETDKTGWKLASSIGGVGTGERGNRILLDDLNNPNDVESETVRAATNHWIREVMPDRLNSLDNDAIINIQQRTHEEDATGTLIKHGVGYTFLCIPWDFDPLRMCETVLKSDEAGEPEEVWRDPRGLDEDGEVLEGLYEDDKGKVRCRIGSPMAKAQGLPAWPERFSDAAINEQRVTKGQYGFEGQYNQAPSVRGGGIIRRDWWHVWSKPIFPNFGTVVACLDTAYKEGQENDYNALIGWGAFAGENGLPNFMLRGAWQDRLPLPELVHEVAKFCREWKADYLLIEDKARGHDVHGEMRRIYKTATWRTVLLPVPSNQDKIARAHGVSIFWSGEMRTDPVTGMRDYVGGVVWAPPREWADEVLDQYTAFPKAAHDDYVDAGVMGMDWMRRNGVVLRPAEFEEMELAKRRYKRPEVRIPYSIG